MFKYSAKRRGRARVFRQVFKTGDCWSNILVSGNWGGPEKKWQVEEINHGEKQLLVE